MDNTKLQLIATISPWLIVESPGERTQARVNTHPSNRSMYPSAEYSTEPRNRLGRLIIFRSNDSTRIVHFLSIISSSSFITTYINHTAGFIELSTRHRVEVAV